MGRVVGQRDEEQLVLAKLQDVLDYAQEIELHGLRISVHDRSYTLDLRDSNISILKLKSLLGFLWEHHLSDCFWTCLPEGFSGKVWLRVMAHIITMVVKRCPNGVFVNFSRECSPQMRNKIMSSCHEIRWLIRFGAESYYDNFSFKEFEICRSRFDLLNLKQPGTLTYLTAKAILHLAPSVFWSIQNIRLPNVNRNKEVFVIRRLLHEARRVRRTSRPPPVNFTADGMYKNKFSFKLYCFLGFPRKSFKKQKKILHFVGRIYWAGKITTAKMVRSD